MLELGHARKLFCLLYRMHELYHMHELYRMYTLYRMHTPA